MLNKDITGRDLQIISEALYIAVPWMLKNTLSASNAYDMIRIMEEIDREFGHFTNLGDGRATLLGEHLNLNKERFDIQLKGSGKTPYSRNGDGKGTLNNCWLTTAVSNPVSLGASI